MTKENKEAIEIFKSELDWAEQNRYPYISENKVKADKLAIQALEAQPSEDCVSRTDVLKLMCEKCPVYNCITGCQSYRSIEKMPSVTLKAESEDT